MLLLQQEDQWCNILAFWNVGWTVIQLKPLALGDGSNWKQKTKDYNGLDKFGNVFESTDWEKGAEEFHIHERCYITLSSKWSLQQSWKRKEKENAANSPTIPEQHDLQEKECQPSSP